MGIETERFGPHEVVGSKFVGIVSGWNFETEQASIVFPGIDWDRHVTISADELLEAGIPIPVEGATPKTELVDFEKRADELVPTSHAGTLELQTETELFEFYSGYLNED